MGITTEVTWHLIGYTNEYRHRKYIQVEDTAELIQGTDWNRKRSLITEVKFWCQKS